MRRPWPPCPSRSARSGRNSGPTSPNCSERPSRRIEPNAEQLTEQAGFAQKALLAAEGLAERAREGWLARWHASRLPPVEVPQECGLRVSDLRASGGARTWHASTLAPRDATPRYPFLCKAEQAAGFILAVLRGEDRRDKPGGSPVGQLVPRPIHHSSLREEDETQ